MLNTTTGIMDPALHSSLQYFAMGTPLRQPTTAALTDWLDNNAFNMPHTNLCVEGMFSIMDYVAAVGGPTMSAGALDARTVNHYNNIQQERPKETVEETGKRKHTTTQNPIFRKLLMTDR